MPRRQGRSLVPLVAVPSIDLPWHALCEQADATAARRFDRCSQDASALDLRLGPKDGSMQYEVHKSVRVKSSEFMRSR
eukprot:COSAG01_NODE_51088_length_357_cov_2.848837_1_plen_77_part_01